jgi:hypothetical protein
MVEEVKKGIKGIRVPTKRVGDTIGDDLFKKKVMQAGFDSLSDFNEAFKAAGGDLGDADNKTRFLNSYLPKEEAPYRNIITDRIKSKYEILSGGATPGTKGAPENKVYWQAASAAEKEAMEKFPKDTKVNKQKRLTYVKKYLKDAGVPAKWLLNNLPKMGLYATAGAAAPISALASAMIYAGTSKPAMGELPKESLKDKVLRDIDFSAPSANAQLLEKLSQDAVMKAGGGMMNINDMIKPLGYKEGTKDGTLVGDREKEIISLLEQQMMKTEQERRADMKGDPEAERMSTYGKVTDNDLNAVALMLARQQGQSSEEDILRIRSMLESLAPIVEGDIKDRTTPTLNKLIKGIGEGISGLFGTKKAEGSTLADDAIKLRILGMKLELQEALPLSVIDEMETMSSDQIIDLYNKTFGK